MQRFKLLGLALVAVFASAAALSTSAFSALPVNLPEEGIERTWTGASEGTPKLLGGGLPEAVECEKAPAEGTEEKGKPLGLFHITFEKCKTSGVAKSTCTGLGDATGIILSLGSWHLVFDKLGTGEELLTAVLFLPEHTHFTCSLALVLVLGALLCLHLEPTSKKTSHSFHCTVQANGEQEDKTYDDENGNPVTAILLCSVNEAAEVPCDELALGSVTYIPAIFADI